jgi:hypothetical protein
MRDLKSFRRETQQQLQALERMARHRSHHD